MKHRKLFAVLFVGLFLALCLIPSVGMFFNADTSAAGNEHLSAVPLFKTEDSRLNSSFPQELTNYISDRFFLRHKLISANTKLLSKCFNVTGNAEVTLGVDDWLFYTETLDDAMGTNILSDRQLWCAAHTLSLMNEYCEDHDAAFLFTVAPNKASLYPEHLPKRLPISEKTNAKAFVSALKEQRIPYADLYSAFNSQDDILYYRTDSHWNDRGAALAADTVLKALNKAYTPFFSDNYSMTGLHKGDLYEMVYPAGSYEEKNAVFNRDFGFEYVGPFRSVEDITIHTSNTDAFGSLLLFRDSFGNSMYPYIADSFANTCISRAMPYIMPALDRENADTVVIELVERNIEWLCLRAPVMEAPERNVKLPDVENISGVQANCIPCGELDGYCVISGNLPVSPDTDSSVYFAADGTVFEASPAGEGQDPFTLYIPVERIPHQCAIAFYSEGTLEAYTVELITQ